MLLLVLVTLNVFPSVALWEPSLDDCDDEGDDCASGYVCDHGRAGYCHERYQWELLGFDIAIGLCFSMIILGCIKNLIQFIDKPSSTIEGENSQANAMQATLCFEAKDACINTWYDVFLVFPCETTCNCCCIMLVTIFGCLGSFFLAYNIPTCCDEYYAGMCMSTKFTYIRE